MTFAEVMIKRMSDLIETANKDSAWEMEAAAEMTKAVHLLSISAQGAVDWPMEVDRLNEMIVRYEAEIHALREANKTFADHAIYGTGGAAQEAMDPNYILPCDMHLPPATRIRKGCKLSTLLTGLRVRETTDTTFPSTEPPAQGVWKLDLQAARDAVRD